MNKLIRAAVAASLLCALVAGCSSGTDPKPVEKAAESTSAPMADPTTEAPSASPSPSTSAPTIAVGKSGTYNVVETDEYGENPRVVTQMEVTPKSADYVTAAQVGTSNEPEHGQYVRLVLKVKNIGKAPGRFSGYGMIHWEDEQTAAQDATTLEGVGEGPELDTSYKPGQSVTGTLILDVARKGGTLSYQTDLIGETSAFTIVLPKS